MFFFCSSLIVYRLLLVKCGGMDVNLHKRFAENERNYKVCQPCQTILHRVRASRTESGKKSTEKDKLCVDICWRLKL